jgi:hypothetical protein
MRTRKMKNPILTCGLNYFLFLTPLSRWGWQAIFSLFGLQLAGNQKQITSVIPSFSYTLHLLHNSIVDLVSGGLDPLRLCDSWPTIMQCCCILNTLVQTSFNFSWVLTLVLANLPPPAWFSPSAIMVLKALRRQGVTPRWRLGAQGGHFSRRRSSAWTLRRRLQNHVGDEAGRFSGEQKCHIYMCSCLGRDAAIYLTSF